MSRFIILFLCGSLMFGTNTFGQSTPPPPIDSVSSEDKIFDQVQIEASFLGGEKAWRQYLEKSLNPNIPVDNGAPDGIYTVIVQFIVDKEGKISDIKALTNEGYGMEREVIKILTKSSGWTSAVQNGRKVKAYRKQPVTFQVMTDGAEIVTAIPFTFIANKDNELSISVPKMKPEDIMVTISHGSIVNKGNGQYIAKVTKLTRAIVRIFSVKKNKEISAYSFIVKEQ